jgi:tetratricopeptide (TPR) repeat protein
MKIQLAINIMLMSVICFSQSGNEKCVFSGIVVELNNLPVTDATVIFKSGSGSMDTLVTDSKGKFCQSNTQSGVFDILCYHTQYGSYELKGVLTKGNYGSVLDTIKLTSIQTQHDKLYVKLVKKADEYYNKNQPSKAAELYERALDFRPTDSYVQNQLNNIIDALQAVEYSLDQYDKIINKANELFTKKDYLNATKLFERANLLDPSDDYPKLMLNSIPKLTGDSLKNE